MNKIDQDKILPQVLDKIKEVNDEAGHRTYLEVPEMIRIICEVIESNYNVTKRNLMDELKEGIDALAKSREQEKKRVYLVFFDGYDQREFIDVFFTEDAAKKYISRKSRSNSYEIEVFEETDNGKSKEIY